MENDVKRIYRSQSDRVLAGVCGGIADYFQVDSSLVRIIWVLVTLFGGSGILAYLVALFIIPEEFEVKGTISSPPRPKEGAPPQVIWGILLVVLGLVLVITWSDVLGLIWSRFWGSGLNVFFALFIIALGIYLIYSKRDDLARVLTRDASYPLHLSVKDKKMAGVCGGIGETIQIDPTLVRFLWVFGTFLSAGMGIILYFILALILPPGPAAVKQED